MEIIQAVASAVYKIMPRAHSQGGEGMSARAGSSIKLK